VLGVERCFVHRYLLLYHSLEVPFQNTKSASDGVYYRCKIVF